jgi:hypothetical protein
MKQMTLQEIINSTTKQNFDKKWATFYEANIPFNVANHPAFTTVEDFQKNLSRLVTNRTKNSIHKYEATIY